MASAYARLSIADKEKMKKLYNEENLSIQKIAERFGCSWCTASVGIKGFKKGTKEYKEQGKLLRKKLKEVVK